MRESGFAKDLRIRTSTPTMTPEQWRTYGELRRRQAELPRQWNTDYRLLHKDLRAFAHACIASGMNYRSLANKTLISVSPASAPARCEISDPKKPELIHSELLERVRDDRAQCRVLGRVCAHRVEFRKT